MSSPQENVSAILDKMGISKVYHIDDGYEGMNEIGIEQVLAQFSSIKIEKLQKIFEGKNREFTNDEDIDKETLRDIWEDLEVDGQKKILLDINASLVWDKQALSLIRELFNDDIINKKNPQEWQEVKEDILAELQDNKILFLFDKDWGRGRETAGIEAIKELLTTADIPQENLLCGLFTHTVTPAEEYSNRQQLATEESIDSDKFLVISKQHEANTFIVSLRTTALIPTLLSFKEKVKESIVEATASVQHDISNLDIVDLEYIVLDKSMNEGDWEPDILYRLHKNRHIKAFRSKIFIDTTIQPEIEKMREIKGIGEQKVKPTSETKELMNHELYDDKINEYLCPLKSGDIFEKGTKKYILLAQPCDLMIREDGKRAFDDYRCFVNLIEITSKESENPLKYYNSEEPLYIHFSQAYKVELDILDLCVFNDEGKILIDLNEEEKRHNLKGIAIRYKKIYSKINKTFNLWKDIVSNPATEQPLKKQFFIPNKQKVFSLNVNKETKIIDFGLKRVSRLTKDQAQILLSEFLQHHGRPASEVDLE